MRILLVDENRDFRSVLGEMLREGLALAVKKAAEDGLTRPPPFAVKEWNPASQGVPKVGVNNFKWNFDAILIDSHVEPADPVAWLTEVRADISAAGGAMPPVVMLTSGHPEEEVMIASAMRLGVTDCISRLKLSPPRLYNALRGAVDERMQLLTIERNLSTGAFPLSNTARMKALQAPESAAPAAPVVSNAHASALPTTPVIAGYRIGRMIGEGGTACVYLAQREADGMELVLKVLKPEFSRDSRVVERFMQEFSLIQTIQSVYVTRIFDLSYDEGQAWLAMEYFGFGDLREKVKGGLNPVEALKLFAQIARALSAIHEAGVIHRDLKPHNIMFRDPHHLAIVDFGGAKSMLDDVTLTKVGHIVGTPNFMSPEQIMGQPLDHRCDIYALGVIFHQLLTGKTLYQADTTAQLLEMQVKAPIPRLPDEVKYFQKLLNRLVAKAPQDRFQSAKELYAYIAY